MTLPRRVSLWDALRYRGGGPMWAWILHRLGGLAMVIFVSMHVIAGFGIQYLGGDWAVLYNTFYESVYFQLVLYFLILFHVVNGLRIIVMDAWPALIKFQREAIWLQWAIVLPIYGIAVWLMLQGGHGG